MADIQPIQLEGEDGVSYTLYIQSPPKEPTRSLRPGDSREAYGLQERIQANLKQVHSTIRGYTYYAIGAFKNLAGAEVEEVKLKFGLQIGGEAGLPILSKGSVTSDFEIEVTCRFPKKEQAIDSTSP